MTHLEQLVYEYYDWKGYLIKHNIKVGRLQKGGWEMELDIIGYHPSTNHLIHIEPSLDSHAWAKKEFRFKKKFSAGKRYILTEIFKELDKKTSIEQLAIIISHSADKKSIGGGKIKSVDQFTKEVCEDVRAEGLMSKSAISEEYPLLRTIQLALCGYYKKT